MAYDVGGYMAGTYTASQVLLRLPFTRARDFADDLSGSQGKSGVTSAGTAVFSIKNDGAEIATMTFTSSTVATFATAGGAESFAVGEVMTVVAPASPDGTLAGVGFLLKGTKA
jgi:hypothetical protein